MIIPNEYLIIIIITIIIIIIVIIIIIIIIIIITEHYLLYPLFLSLFLFLPPLSLYLSISNPIISFK